MPGIRAEVIAGLFDCSMIDAARRTKLSSDVMTNADATNA